MAKQGDQEQERFSTVLRAIRDIHRLTQESMSQLLGVSTKTVNRWETRRSYPTEHQRRAILGLITEAYPAHRDRLARCFGIASVDALVASPSTTVLAAALDGALFQATEVLGAPPAKVREAVALVLERVALLGLDAKTAATLVAGKK